MIQVFNGRFAALGMAMLAMLMMTFSQFAEAKRLGGGGSFGYQKQVAPKSFSNKQTPTQKPAQQPTQQPAGAAGAAAAGTAAKSGASKWLGPLAGLAAGGLLAAMIFGDGFEGLQIMDILLFALIAFLLFKLFTAKKRQSQQAAYSGHQQYDAEPQQSDYQHRTAQQEPEMQRQAQEPTPQAAQPEYNPNAGGSIFGADLEPVGDAPSAKAHVLADKPEWFDEAGFIEGAKSHFVSMQSAWDQVDVAKLGDYCTETLLEALKPQLAEMQPGENHTNVDELQAEIAQMAIEDDYFYVSVRYSGFIDEDGQGAHAFSEIWHIRRLVVGEGNWQVAGIQQVQ